MRRGKGSYIVNTSNVKNYIYSEPTLFTLGPIL